MKIYIKIAVLVVIGFAFWFIFAGIKNDNVNTEEILNEEPTFSVKLPEKALVELDYYINQTWNNCSIAATAMALDHYGIRVDQADLAKKIRPYNNLNGDNDDKSTVFEELVREVENYGLKAYYRPAGNIELLRQLTASGFPVVVRTLVDAEGDYLHFRVVTGYDETKGVIIQDDSMQGKGLEYKYEDFLKIWQQFNYQYMVIAKTDDDEKTIERIIGKNIDTKIAWQSALQNAEFELKENPNDVRAHFNKVTALFYLGEYEKTAKEFEKIESKLSRHVLWYQIEPILAYFNLKKYDRVVELADKVLNDNNKAVSELYILKGKIYQENGDVDLARSEFEKAVLYNNTSPEAIEALESLN